MATIQITADGLDIDLSTAKRYTKLLNLICDDLAADRYQEGCRNNMAVDLCILCYELGLEPMPVAELAWENVEDPDKDDLEDRINVIEDYCSWWHKMGAESYMLMDQYNATEPKQDWITLV